MNQSELTADLIHELDEYRRILNNIPAEIGVFDPEGRFLFNTPSGIRDPQVREWVLGRTHHDFCRERNYPIEIADRRQAVIEQVVREKEAVLFEELWTTKEGQQKNYARTFSPVLDDRGNVTHVLGFGKDITALKQTEEQLRRALTQVEALKDRLHAENVYLQEELRSHHNVDEIVGRSASMDAVLSAIQTVAPTDANVVILGETGTGKELVARAVHSLSGRKDKPLIKVNCASVPRELFESEFFGHVRGAFTGAVKDRIGRFQLAHRGTLFLDEVAETPLEMQSKLLRVLQEGEYERVGEGKTRQSDARLIAATNRDLKAEVEAGRFRRDLYYRLNVFPIEVPTLRHRRDDIELLATYHLERISRRLGRKPRKLTKAEVSQLTAYDWPGNVRELQNVIERAIIRQSGERLDFELQPKIPQRGGAPAPTAQPSEFEVITDAEMRRRERDNIVRALERTNGIVFGPRGAAALLGIKPTTLASRLEKMGVH